MHHDYEDIRSRIAEPPLWWDENAVPRYCAFEPNAIANIYADEAVLAEITCQRCGRPFRVAFSQDGMQRCTRKGNARLADDIRLKELHYGDPPNARCCDAGPTMNSEPRRVLEYWSTHHAEYVVDGLVKDGRYFDWRRDPGLEVAIVPDWVEEAPPHPEPPTPETAASPVASPTHPETPPSHRGGS